MDKFFEKKASGLDEIEHNGAAFEESRDYHSSLLYIIETEEGVFISKKKLTYPQVAALVPDAKQVFVVEDTIYLRQIEKPAAVEKETAPVAKPTKNRRTKQKPQA